MCAYQDLRLEQSDKRSRSDSHRDAEKYRQLVRALRHATSEIRLVERRGQHDIEAVLVKLLPDMAAAINGLRAFLLREDTRQPLAEPTYELVRFFAQDGLRPGDFASTPLLQQVFAAGQPRVIDSLDGEADQVIRGLEFCQATSAILLPLKMVDQQYLVGICNKYDSNGGPFLASDRMTLENLLELIAIGGRVNERSRRELASIERISQITTLGTPREVADEIVFQAVVMTEALYAALWMIDQHSLQVDCLTAHHRENPWWRPRQRRLPLDDASLIGWVAQRGEARYEPELAQLSYSDWDDETASAFCMPLIFSGQTLGLLYLTSSDPNGIHHEERRFVERLAPHAAIALHNTRVSEIRKRIIRFHEEVSDLMGLEDQLEQILAHLERQVDLSGFFLAMYNSESNLIHFPVAYDHGQPVAERLRQPGALYGPQEPGSQRLGFVEWVLQHRKTLLVENFATWPERYAIDPRVRAGVKSCLVTPLLRNGRIVGALGLRGYIDSPGSFDEYDQEFLEGIANHIAVVLDNSQRFDRTQLQLEEANAQLQQRINELRAVSEFQRKISDIDEESEEIENIYHEAHKAMQGVGLDTSHLYIGLYEERDQTLWFPLVYEHGAPLDEVHKSKHPLYRRAPLQGHGSIAAWLIERWQQQRERQPVLIKANFRQWLQEHGLTSFATNTGSWLGAPMIYKDKLVGMIGLRSSREFVFREEHCALLATIASQAAIALENARLFTKEKREVREFRALHAAGKAITKAGLQLDDVLQAILEQAIEVTGAFFGTVQLVVDDYLQCRAAWPMAERENFKRRFGKLPLNGPGITARAVRRNDAQLVPDVSQDPDFVEGLPHTGSELAVVLRRGGEEGAQPVGVLNVEHLQVGALTMEQRSVLIGLSNLAVVAIENTQQAEQLSRSNAVAVMGAWGADIVHDIHREVARIRLAIETLRMEDEVPRTLLMARLEEIDEYVINLIMPELPDHAPADGSPDHRIVPVPVDLVIKGEVNSLRPKHGGVHFVLATTCSGVEVTMHEQWLRRLLRHLVLNAVRANEPMAQELTITIGTQRQPGAVEVWVKDNGRGIRPEITDLLFNRPIAHGDEHRQERHGRGLLLVRHIVELHGGKAWLKSDEPGPGACIAFTIPSV